jgi:hypothetical protein
MGSTRFMSQTENAGLGCSDNVVLGILKAAWAAIPIEIVAGRHWGSERGRNDCHCQSNNQDHKHKFFHFLSSSINNQFQVGQPTLIKPTQQGSDWIYFHQISRHWV